LFKVQIVPKALLHLPLPFFAKLFMDRNIYGFDKDLNLAGKYKSGTGR
jgi:hypothetical protein